jgi:tetratricopeptide (TPR) repeat protein
MLQRFPCRAAVSPRSRGFGGRRLLLLAVLAGLPARMPAQEEAPKRPHLAKAADTNSAAAYYAFGREQLRAERPQTAADAFYWATRLAPDWADPLYARWVALLLSHPDRLVPYMEDDETVIESPEVQRIDSLRLRALELDPFVYEDLEHELVMQYVTERLMLDLRQRYLASDIARARRELEHEVELYLRLPASARWRAWIAYADRRLDDAAKYYAEALAKAHEDEHEYRSRLHAQRARSFYLAGRRDSAQAELREAIAELRRRDESVTLPVYESKAQLEHSLGVALESTGDLAGAREAYGRALVEDLAFYPAHVRLAGLLAATGDTAGARKEYEMALDVAPGAVVARVLLANLYNAGGDYHAAVTTLEPLLESEPYWPEPYLLRGVILQRLGDLEGAAAQYTKFLELAERTDDRRAAVTQRLAALRKQ